MARPKKVKEEQAEVTADVIGSTVEDRQDANSDYQGASVVTLCVSLRNGHIFDDIPDGKGGYKKVHLAGLDDALRGKKGGVLADKGNAVYQTMPKADWDALFALHGKERMFNSWNGFPPCVFEVKSVSEAKKSEVIQDQIKASKTGLDPLPEDSSI